MIVTVVSYMQEFTMELGHQEAVLDIKKRLGQFLEVPVSSITLTVSGWELLDGLDMEDYPIVSDGSKIDLSVNSIFTKTRNIAGKIYVNVKFPSKQFTVEVDRTETVRSLKEKIHIIDGAPIKRMQLYYTGIELGDDFRNLYEYGIHESSEIIVFIKTINRAKDIPPVRRLCFVVQTSSSLFNGARIPVEMKDSCTVEDMRNELLTNKMLPRDDYIFVHKQRIMRENCSLRWHGVETGETLFVFKGSVSRSGYW